MKHKAEELLATANFNTRHAQPVSFRDADYKLNVENGSRWNLREAPFGQGVLMRSCPAMCEQSDLFPQNPHPHAVIEFEFDGSMDSVIYMMHEMGHAMADDNILKPAGYKHGDNGDKQHLAETQAYFTQFIAYDFLENHSDPTIAAAAKHHRQAAVTVYGEDVRAAEQAVTMGSPERDNLIDTLHGRPASFFTAAALHHGMKKQDENQRQFGADYLLGKYGAKDITQVLSATGIERPDQMARLADDTARQMATSNDVLPKQKSPDLRRGL